MINDAKIFDRVLKKEEKKWVLDEQELEKAKEKFEIFNLVEADHGKATSGDGAEPLS